MALRVFAAVDVGSYELGMKIFEFSRKNGMKEIDSIRHSIELGTDTYQNGLIDMKNMDELCDVLSDFSSVMKSYKVDDYKAYGTSAIRETKNTEIVLEQIKLRTGIKVDVLSNSEQRFLHYKAAALKGSRFDEFIREGCAIVDIGGGSIQISLFDNDALVTTQNIRLGVLRTMDMLADLQPKTRDIEGILRELIDNQLQVFRKLYLKGKTIKNLILIDDYVSEMLYHTGSKTRTFTAEKFKEMCDELKTMSISDIAKVYGIGEETAPLLVPAVALVSRVIRITKAENIWSPGVSLCDGMAYEYAEKEKLVNYRHDFDNDIIACAKAMSKRYQGNEERNELIERVAVDLFESTRKIHGMGKREKLLLRIASLLSDCGRYISIEAGAECGYDIIMATEMIGLSHVEREIVANIVRFNKMQFKYYSELATDSLIDKGSYQKIAKLSALFRIADGICRSYRTKVNDVRFSVKGNELVINVYTVDDINLEQGFFFRKASLFEEVFSIKPILRYKRL
ncbi:MAG: exopolyphosphatase [Lachnospiraceae bacterium]|nr:exopolyphosphatase [Lachnospiraceae bacterium]